jgi:microsomal epoxide hydrolase
MKVEPFRISVPEEVLVDLHERLRRTRWPDDPGGGWRYGVPLAWLQALCEYWVDGFDWCKVERSLNSYPQFLAHVDGIPIHFVHVRGKGPAPVPLVMTVGWPSTFVEVLPVVDLLTDPGAHGGDARDAVDLVIPDLLGERNTELRQPALLRDQA